MTNPIQGRTAAVSDKTDLADENQAAIDFRVLANMPVAERNKIIFNMARDGYFDFLDFGTHKGGGLRKGVALGGRQGLGVDLNDKKIRQLLAEGYAAFSGDLLNFEVSGRPFSFAICRHVLEHMPSKSSVSMVIDKLRELCSDFIFIEQPSFDHDDYLAEQGLVLGPSTLEYHTCRMTVDDFFFMLRDLGLRHFVIGGLNQVTSTADKKIFCSDALPNRMIWNAQIDSEKPYLKFRSDLFRNIIVVVALSDSVDPAQIASRGGVKKIQLTSFY